ncbi:MAG: thiamine phosphate synthase, partial [Proteobacteria bacterium]|nr:thiamine phosphate synthase [Pseudomonadota bacterium]
PWIRSSRECFFRGKCKLSGVLKPVLIGIVSMRIKNLTQLLRFYFITDDQAPGLSPMEQVKIAIRAGATFIQYRNKSFSLPFLQEAMANRNLCKRYSAPFVVLSRAQDPVQNALELGKVCGCPPRPVADFQKM